MRSTSHEHPDPTPTHPPENEDLDTSPESAAVARGAARTAASSTGRSASAATRGAMAGRIPVASRTAAAAKASKTMARAPKISARPVLKGAGPPRMPKVPRPIRPPRGMSRSSPKMPSPKIASRIPKARANTIARASDRASKGLDVLSAGLEQNQSVESNSNYSQSDNDAKRNSQTRANAQISKSIKQGMQQIASFGKIFVTNTILGMAVFATYEEIIDHVAPPLSVEETAKDDFVHISDSESSGDRDDDDPNSALTQIPNHDIYESNDAMDRATLPQHFFAGAMGGAAHAVLSLGLEVKLNVSSDRLSTSASGTNYTFTNLLQQQHKPVQLQIPAMNYSISSIFHHSVAHSVLFGSYQLTKRLLLQYLPASSWNPNSVGSNDAIHVASIAVAGGLAGQFQHATSRFTEQWLGLVDEEVKRSSSSSLLRHLKSATWPTWRSTMLAFPPSAIGFLAFEYGKVMIAGDDATISSESIR